MTIRNQFARIVHIIKSLLMLKQDLDPAIEFTLYHLSTVSSGINAMACVTVEDFIRPFVKWQEKTLTRCSQGLQLLKFQLLFSWINYSSFQGLVFTYGLLCIGFACLSSLLGGVLQASLSVIGVMAGPLLGIFSIGIVFPCANSIVSILVMWFFQWFNSRLATKFITTNGSRDGVAVRIAVLGCSDKMPPP